MPGLSVCDLIDHILLTGDWRGATIWDAMGNWFISKGAGQEEGPITIETIMAKVASGEVSFGVLVWREGMEKWVPLSDVPEIGVSRASSAKAEEGARPKIPVPGKKSASPSSLSRESHISDLFERAAKPLLALMSCGAISTAFFFLVHGIKKGQSAEVILAVGSGVILGLVALISWEALRATPRWLISVRTKLQDRVVLHLSLVVILGLMSVNSFFVLISIKGLGDALSGGGTFWGGSASSGLAWQLSYFAVGIGILGGLAASLFATIRPSEIGVDMEEPTKDMDVAETFCALFEVSGKLFICAIVPTALGLATGSLILIGSGIYEYTFSRGYESISSEAQGLTGVSLMLVTGVGLSFSYLAALCALSIPRFLKALLCLFDIKRSMSAGG